jgi:hypothetical protein
MDFDRVTGPEVGDVVADMRALNYVKIVHGGLLEAPGRTLAPAGRSVSGLRIHAICEEIGSTGPGAVLPLLFPPLLYECVIAGEQDLGDLPASEVGGTGVHRFLESTVTKRLTVH